MKVIILMSCLLLTIECSLRVSEEFNPNFSLSFNNKDLKTILFLGDSILSNIPEEFKKLINAKKNHQNVVVYKEAIPSAKIYNINKDLDLYLNKYKPSIVFTLLGKSDSKTYNKEEESDFVKEKSFLRTFDLFKYFINSTLESAYPLYLKTIDLFADSRIDLKESKGYKLHKAGKLEEAISWYKEQIALDPADTALLSFIAESYLALEQYEMAEKYLKKYLSINQDDVLAYNPLITALTNQNKFEEAIKLGKKALSISPNNLIIIKRVLDTLLFTKDNAFELSLLKKLEDLDPNSFIFCESKSNYFIKMRLWDNSIEQLKKCIKYNSKLSFVFDNIANSYMKLNNYTQALIYYKKAILADFDSQPRHANAVLYGLRMNKLNELREFYLFELSDVQRKNPALQGALARIYLEENDLDKAYFHLTNALKAFPEKETTQKLAELFKTRHPKWSTKINLILKRTLSQYNDILFDLYPTLSDTIRSKNIKHIILNYPDKALPSLELLPFREKSEISFISLWDAYEKSNNKKLFFEPDNSHMTPNGSREAALLIYERSIKLF